MITYFQIGYLSYKQGHYELPACLTIQQYSQYRAGYIAACDH